MAGIESQQVNRLPMDHYPRSSPHQYNHQLRGAQIPHPTNNGQFGGQLGDVPPAAGRGVQGGLEPNHIHEGNHGMTAYPRLLGDLAPPYVYPNVGFGQTVPEHEQVILPGNEGNCVSGYGPQGVVPDPVQIPLLNLLAQQGPGQPVAENLRRLASRYVHHPDSQVGVVHIEPGSAGRYKVVIALEIADIL